MILSIHTLFSILALFCGVIFLIPRGTKRHKQLGYVYSFSMLICLITSFWLYELWGKFGVYHVLSIVSFVTLMIALYFPLKARYLKNWGDYHLIWMGYSYIGLVMAGGSHLFGVVPERNIWIRVGLFWVLPYVLGSVLIFSNKAKASAKAKLNMGS